jgi:hypothetical protein
MLVELMADEEASVTLAIIEIFEYIIDKLGKEKVGHSEAVAGRFFNQKYPREGIFFAAKNILFKTSAVVIIFSQVACIINPAK